MPCGWEGNRMSGVAMAMRHRLQWFIHLPAHGLRKGDEHRPTLLVKYGPIYIQYTAVLQRLTNFASLTSSKTSLKCLDLSAYLI